MQSSWVEKVITVLNGVVRFSAPLTEKNFEATIDRFSFQHYHDLLPSVLPLKYSCLETLASDFGTSGHKILSFLKDGSQPEQRDVLAHYFKFGGPDWGEFEPDIVYLLSCSPKDSLSVVGMADQYPDGVNVLFVLFFLPGEEWKQLPSLEKKRGPVRFRSETCSLNSKKARDFRMAFRVGEIREEFPDASFFLCSPIASMKEICVLMEQLGSKCELFPSCEDLKAHFFRHLLDGEKEKEDEEPLFDLPPLPRLSNEPPQPIDIVKHKVPLVNKSDNEVFSGLDATIDSMFDGYSAVLQPKGIPLALLGQKFSLPPSLKKQYGGFQRFIASSEVKSRLAIELETDQTGVTFFHKKFGPEEKDFCPYCLQHSFFSRHLQSSPDCLSQVISQIRQSLSDHSEKEIPLSLVVAGISFPDSIKKCFKNWSALIDCPSIQKELKIQMVRDHIANNFNVIKK